MVESRPMRPQAQLAIALLSLAALGLPVACGGGNEPGSGDGTTGAPAVRMGLESSAFAEGEPIPEEHTCDGANTSPPLVWSDLPEGARSVAIRVDDPDAPGGTFTHWLGWDLDPGAGGLEAGQAAPVEGANDTGESGYSGPCPPSEDGPHRYVFHVYALDLAELGLDAGVGVDAGALQAAIAGHVLAKGEYTGTYER
jgi:Raf kinase inhibitor-like YbhB/YbcL family protein